MKKLTSILLALCLVLSIGAIAFADEAPTLGFILGSREHAFYCSIEDGINAAAEELGFEAVVLESNLSGDIATERIEDLVTMGVDAISLACNEPAGCTQAIINADKDGVPMFTFDCTTTLTDCVKCFVGTDNYQGGVVGGEATIKALEDMGMTDGAVIGIIGYPEPQSCIDREEGWYSVVNEYEEKYNLTIVNIGNYEGQADIAQQLMDGALTEYPDMACIFTVGDPACIGALAAIKNAGATTKMIGFDANPEAHAAILDEENGKIWFADVAQDPYNIGYQISEQMLKYVKEGTVDEQTILISPYLVDASNAIPQK
ncbi:MAG: substrate-binding domain-containing protein [Eubacteriales bacterium]|nr:substrate-binding domain-containing protein [Eubacteriales bacterium]